MSLHVSWDEYNTLVERLALKVYESGFDFNQIICIARGGLRVGDVLSRIYEQPLAILSTHSYAAEGGTIRGELVIAEHMTMTSPRLGDRVLLVDDMVDSGHTLETVVQRRCRSASRTSPSMKTAVLWWKACSVFKPDYLRRVPARQSVDPPAVRGLRRSRSGDAQATDRVGITDPSGTPGSRLVTFARMPGGRRLTLAARRRPALD